MKRCKTCGDEKPFDEFPRDPSNTDGRKPHCKKCHARYMKGRNAAWRRKLRLEAIFRYGSRCACCGEDEFEFLAIDHIEGGGNKHRQSGQFHPGIGFLTWLKKNNWPDGYRVLCHNCNSAIGYYGFCPHEKRKQFAVVTKEN